MTTRRGSNRQRIRSTLAVDRRAASIVVKVVVGEPVMATAPGTNRITGGIGKRIGTHR